MCGFTGFFNFPQLNSDDYKKFFISVIKNRGPDKSNNLLIKNKLNLFFARLSIVDLSSYGDQPMNSISNKMTIVFNGEIYNHKELRNKLEKINITLRGNSDTEVLLECIENFGFDVLQEVRGMFAFALYDHIKSYLYFINDRFGEKPLYYYFDSKSIFFSSDIKSFTFKKRSLNKLSVKYFFNNNAIPYPYTIWKDVDRIKPSEIIKFKLNFEKNEVKKINSYNYWSPKNYKALSKDPIDIVADKLENMLFEVIEKQLDNDVSTGCFLSGGVDSSLVSAIASKIRPNKIKTISIGFKDKKLDESRYAIKIADYLKTDHSNKILDVDDISNILESIPNIYGEPFSDSSQIPTALLCKFASEKIKVALTGDGGDEIFGGYDRYHFVPKFWKYLSILPTQSRLLIKKTMEMLSPYSYQLFTFIIQKLLMKYKSTVYFENKLRNLILSLDSKNPVELAKKLSYHYFDDFNLIKDTIIKDKTYIYDKSFTAADNIMINDISDYLPNDLLVKVDRAAMYYGLENRSPFLDHVIYEYSKEIPLNYKIQDNKSKVILKKILSRHIPNNLFERPKHGFLAPLSEVIQANKNYFKKFVNNKNIKEQNILNEYIALDEINNFNFKSNINQYNIWDIIIFQQWMHNNKKNII